MNGTATPLNAALAPRGFEPRPVKELTCFSTVLTGGCEIDSLITSCFTGRRGYDFRQGQSEVQNLDEPCVPTCLWSPPFADPRYDWPHCGSTLPSSELTSAPFWDAGAE